jgi:serine/threonine protein kinase
LVLALGLGAGVALAGSLSAILLGYFTSYWFPWLIIVGGQVPCAMGWALIMNIHRLSQTAKTAATGPVPDTPGYELIRPIGEGSYGKVWLARTKTREWRALKVVSLANFVDDPTPYEREFNGVKKYQPISDRHPGLLRVDFVSEKLAGCFYYSMELADSLEPGWEKEPARYKTRDLTGERAHLHKHRLPVKDCLSVGITLSEALDFLHRQGMTHRDIKPQNIIFINGRPKIADLGLVTDIRPANEERTAIGTRGYMPPPPELPGTVAADIYALGMMLYVLSTGRPVGLFPEVATTLVSTEEPPEFLPLNEVINQACQPNPEDRYASAEEMRVALEAARRNCN